MTKQIKSIHKNYAQHGIDSTPPSIRNHSLVILSSNQKIFFTFGYQAIGGAASMPNRWQQIKLNTTDIV